MSRIGKQKIIIPSGVSVTVDSGEIKVAGPAGKLSRRLDPSVTVSVTGNEVVVGVAQPDEKRQRSLWGTFAAHIKNMIVGVTQGFKKQLEINGVGYRVALQGKDLKLEVGYSHPVIFVLPDGAKATVEKNIITVQSSDIELLGRVAADIRAVRKPEPYKGKGIKYVEEVIRRKAGKAAAKAAA